MIVNNLSLSVIIPIYNEQENIILAIEKTMAEVSIFKNFELVVINDGSDDDTNQKLIELSIKYENLILIKHDKNMGLAQSLKDGFLKASNEYILFNSADLSLAPKDISFVIEQKYPFDLLVIERNKNNGAALRQKFVSFCNRVILHIFFPLALIDIADCNFTFILKKEILKNIFPGSKSKEFVQPEIILKAKYLKYNVKSIEVVFNKREKGKSYIGTLKDILYSLFDIVKFRIYSICIFIWKR
jgi:glycosyltransferase involved in cell wall biosynthesis